MLSMRALGLFLVIGWLALPLHAQQAPADYERAYQSALQQLRRQDYEGARFTLASLTHARYTHALAPLAHYFYALASFRAKQYGDAKRMLRQVLDRFPKWNRRADAYYLLGAVAFAENQPLDALQWLSRIDDPLLDADVAALKNQYIGAMTDINVLRRLQREYPDDPVLGTYLALALRRGTPSRADQDLANRLARRFGESRPAPSPPATPAAAPGKAAPRPTGKKAVYTVSVLFPFDVEQLDALNRPDASNQYIVEMYQGMRMAVQKLQTEGITINLQAYDVENDAKQADLLTRNAVFQQSDLLVGPLYAGSFPVVAEWARAQGVPLVSPLSINSLMAGPGQYLMRSSVETQGRQAAEFARQRFGKGPVLVFYGTSRNDSLLAAEFYQTLARARVEVLRPVRITGNRATQLAEAKAQLGTRRPAGTLLAFLERDTGPGLITALRQAKIEGPVLVSMDAFPPVRPGQSVPYAGDQVYLWDSDFVDPNKPETRDFFKRYYNQVRSLATSSSYRGYDLMLFFGRVLGQYGTSFPARGLTLTNQEGFLRELNYRTSYDNQALPIVQHNGTTFERVR
jgi:predicted negative regulator of RcsB-dependent stress response